jgi:hypothetical protein
VGLPNNLYKPITNTAWVRARRFQQYFSYIMATSFSGGRSRSTRRESPTIGKQLVNFITCGCESSAPFFVAESGIKTPKSNRVNLSDFTAFYCISGLMVRMLSSSMVDCVLDP